MEKIFVWVYEELEITENNNSVTTKLFTTKEKAIKCLKETIIDVKEDYKINSDVDLDKEVIDGISIDEEDTHLFLYDNNINYTLECIVFREEVL